VILEINTYSVYAPGGQGLRDLISIEKDDEEVSREAYKKYLKTIISPREITLVMETSRSGERKGEESLEQVLRVICNMYNQSISLCMPEEWKEYLEWYGRYEGHDELECSMGTPWGIFTVSLTGSAADVNATKKPVRMLS